MSSSDPENAGNSLEEFVRLMTEHQYAIRGFILSLMPGSPDVADVLQETNMVLWRKRKRFKIGTNFLAWASTVARYEVMRHRERVRRHSHLPFSDELINMLAEGQGITASQEGRLMALERCLEKLSEKHRGIVAQRYTPGRSLEAHAEVIGTSAGSLRVTLHRIRQSLKRCVQQTITGEAHGSV